RAESALLGQVAGVQLVILALFGDQFVVAAALDDAALFQDDDAVGVADGGQPVGDDEGGAAVHQAVHAGLDHRLGAGVDGAGGLVQDQHRRVGHRRPGNGQQLALALGQVGAVAGQHGVVAVGQPADEAVRVGQFGGHHAFFVGGVQPAVADVVHHGAGDQVGDLQGDAKRAAQVGLYDLSDVDTVVEYVAWVDCEYEYDGNDE